MVQNRRPEIGDVVTAYRIKHPFTVVTVHEEIDAVKLKYPDGSLTRLIPLSAIELISEKSSDMQL
jgi:hypothetical protein